MAKATTISCLSTLCADTPLVALAFQCQMFPEIPMQAHDVFMDKVITEDAVYAGQGKSHH